jgi:hypothetical protein
VNVWCYCIEQIANLRRRWNLVSTNRKFTLFLPVDSCILICQSSTDGLCVQKQKMPCIDHFKSRGIARASTIGNTCKSQPNLINQARMGRNRNGEGVDNPEYKLNGNAFLHAAAMYREIRKIRQLNVKPLG